MTVEQIAIRQEVRQMLNEGKQLNRHWRKPIQKER